MTKTLAILAAVVILAAAGAWAWLSRPAPERAYDMIGLEALTQAELATESYRFVPMILQVVYEAFGATDEARIYDGLALVSDGAALEQLYLERVGAMRDGGLNPDQEIHEIALLSMQAAPGEGESVALNARWRVLGVVGHAEHMHMRGNAYAADLTLEPVDGAWKLTGFSLRDVDRTDAGTLAANADMPAAEDGT